MSGSKPHWSDREFSKAMSLIERGHTLASAAAIIGRPVVQLREKIRWENMSAQRREELRERTNARRRAKATGAALKSIRPNQVFVANASRPSPDLLEEAKSRLYAPRTLSQQLLGDPAPGYSALDRKRQGLPA